MNSAHIAFGKVQSFERTTHGFLVKLRLPWGNVKVKSTELMYVVAIDGKINWDRQMNSDHSFLNTYPRVVIRYNIDIDGNKVVTGWCPREQYEKTLQLVGGQRRKPIRKSRNSRHKQSLIPIRDGHKVTICYSRGDFGIAKSPQLGRVLLHKSRRRVFVNRDGEEGWISDPNKRLLVPDKGALVVCDVEKRDKGLYAVAWDVCED